MHRRDLTPLLRATVGFDRMMNLLDSNSRLSESEVGYPPYNIEKTGQDLYRITMAVAGFAEDELEITAKENSLLVEGRKAEKESTEEGEETIYLHRGIANRSFQRHFELADHIKITGASLENGLLTIDMVRELPEAMKPKSIPIQKVTSQGSKRENERKLIDA